MIKNCLVGEVLKPTSPIVKFSDDNVDSKMHPLVLVHNDGESNFLFHLTSNKNFNSILSSIISYKLTPGMNIQYNSQIVEMNTYVRCDMIHKVGMEDLNNSRRFFAYLTPDTRLTIEDIVSNNYFIYSFLKNNNVVEENYICEDLKNNIFYNDYEMYENRRYKQLISLLLDRNNYISFIKEINHEYNVNLDVDSTYYQYLQDVKQAYSQEERVSKRVA